jgi:hypothetical protein
MTLVTGKSALSLRMGLVFLFVSAALVGGADATRAAPAQTHYKTPQDAVTSLVTALRSEDMTTLQGALGSEGDAILHSGDNVQDKAGRDRFLAAYDKKASIVDKGPAKSVLEVGDDAWPFPIPLVREPSGWRFDTAAGKEEILNRRIGRNELSVIQVALAYADAQRDYATYDRDGDKVLEYAQRFISTPGKKDGLYWPTKDNEPESPLGDGFTAAQAKGYQVPAKQGAEPTSYYGYQYKLLTAQGPNAAGGAFDYIVKGNMIGGFALVAYPTTYANSGVMTFVINHDGEVFQKDLGDNTQAIARAMTKYDPDKTWTKQDPRMAAAQ